MLRPSDRRQRRACPGRAGRLESAPAAQGTRSRGHLAALSCLEDLTPDKRELAGVLQSDIAQHRSGQPVAADQVQQLEPVGQDLVRVAGGECGRVRPEAEERLAAVLGSRRASRLVVGHHIRPEAS